MPFEGSCARFYRDEAKRIRRLAAASEDFPDIKQQLAVIADQYERLAEQYERGVRR